MSLNFFYPIGKEPEKDPVIDLLPDGYKSAAVIFSPFFKMPDGWDSPDGPSDEEVYQFADRMSWKEIETISNLRSISEVSKAVKNYVNGGLVRELYQKKELVEKINDKFDPGMFFPHPDQLPILLIDDMLAVLGSRGAEKVLYNKLDGDGELLLSEIDLKQKLYLCSGPTLLMDEKEQFVFTCFFDEASMVFFTKEGDFNCFKGTTFEGVYLEKETPIIWENHQCTYFNYDRT
ncbi:DUF2711 family protein [Bacillus sp. ISL-37]|uniref:DUF2711 family protein n=1 Tax=Bacillus sp. ISL-37 TaxID=2819123 RepID=UPI001BE80A57|nr:DUF2711 family protein [Bacillus sp. ISL-37]MBT2685860.1 DUF2711 family protein [Bacillus sp. ISL-37]